ncbi:hypothetical protein K493DRAFT_296831 [Basidiobolus meristosporus CBS 931.73]|uniref:Rap-GAP domain-containing protein n=1 Tax=Basidiobolus meristosporus CBS 931.73 TaxID=1314790 RepID=A0A1Y1Z3Z8_9FUNG|nr:hypothetical protein K493DRAFT_296831 [Basidiobolus meristosporus CBS 931.73]|eukprot:ORY04707.1 hypothetical protein K493DRAFT_296831 [Basidiobolus meristosporus CBS 931.73]
MNPSKQEKSQRFGFFRMFGPRASNSSLRSLPKPIATNDVLNEKIVSQELSSNIPLASKIKIIQELTNTAKNYILNDVAELWVYLEGFLQKDMPTEARHATFNFVIVCTHTQFEHLGMARGSFYDAICTHDIWEDCDFQLKALQELTRDGRDITHFEKNITRLLLDWLMSAFQKAQFKRSLPEEHTSLSMDPSLPDPEKHFISVFSLLNNIAKFNFTSLEEREIIVLINEVCMVSNTTKSLDDIQLCINFFDVIIRYGYVPLSCLKVYVETCCRNVNISQFSLATWNIVRNLLRSHCAHNTVKILCSILKDKSNFELVPLLRGAVFFLGMATWGSQAVEGLSVPVSTPLIAMREALQFKQSSVDYDILLNVHRLVKKQSESLSTIEWDVVFDILEYVCYYVTDVQLHSSNQICTLDADILAKEVSPSTLTLILTVFSKTIVEIQGLHTGSSFSGPVTRLIKTLQTVRKYLPTSSALVLMNYYASDHAFYPSSPDWLEQLVEATQTFYHNEERVVLRERMLNIVADVYHAVKEFYYQDFMNGILLPIFNKMKTEEVPQIRISIMNLLLDAMTELDDQFFERLLQLFIESAFGELSKFQRKSSLDSSGTSDTRRTLNRSNSLSSSALGLTTSSAFQKLGGKKPNEGDTLVKYAIELVHLFKRTLTLSNPKQCLSLFTTLLDIVTSANVESPIRVIALQGLTLLRANSKYRIYIDQSGLPTRHNPPLSTEASLSLANSPIPTSDASGPLPTAEISEDIYSNFTPFSAHDDHMDGPEPDNPASSSYTLPIGRYLAAITTIIESENDWPILSHIFTNLPNQLTCKQLFHGESSELNALRSKLCSKIMNGQLLNHNVNLPGNLKRGDVYAMAYKILYVLVGYRRLFNKAQQDEIILTFQIGLQKWSQTAKLCIHALNVCCYELPMSMTKLLPSTLIKLSQVMSTSAMSVHILEFLSALARLPNLYVNFVESDFKRVFGIALQYIQYNNAMATSQNAPQSPVTSPRGSTHGSINTPPQQGNHALLQYVLVLAYHVIYVWFMSLRLPDRRKYVSFIIRGLLIANERNKQLDELTETCVDMLTRYSYANSYPKPQKSFITDILLDPSKTVTRSWVYGTSIVTFRSSKYLGWGEILNKHKLEDFDFAYLPALLMMHWEPVDGDEVKPVDTSTEGSPTIHSKDEGESNDNSREEITISSSSDSASKSDALAETAAQPFGRFALPFTLQSHINSSTSDQTEQGRVEQEKVTSLVSEVITDTSRSKSHRNEDPSFDPAFMFMQMLPYPELKQKDLPLLLPDDDATGRALGVLDRTPVVDFHKVGIVYVGKGQTNEVEILNNTCGSPSYLRFLASIGTVFRLNNCKEIYTGGLDTENDFDGEFAYYWKDDITQIIFHATTLMPSNPQTDPQCTAKKRHIGNDFVSVVYNDSGKNYRFDTIPGQFNFVNIVIEPLFKEQLSTAATDEHYKVYVQLRQDMPEISPISEFKILSAVSLPFFVRQIALHANIFAQVFLQSGGGGRMEYVSNWKERLRQIKRLKERMEKNTASASPEESNQGVMGLESILDFTRFT